MGVPHMITFGNRIEPLTDRYLLDKSENVTFRINPPVRVQKVLGFDMPWEAPGSLANTVFEDNGIVKLYYRGFPGLSHTDADDHQTTCLAVSTDGLHFERVPINEIEYDGIKENNILRMDSYSHNFMVFKDTNPSCKPEEAYKAIAGTDAHNGLHVFGSPDGIHWKEMSDGPVLLYPTQGTFDSMNTAFFDASIGKYRCYSRYFTGPSYWEGLRAIQSSVSDDFLHWEEQNHNIYTWDNGADPTDQLYTNAAAAIPGADHMLISFPMRYSETRKKVAEHPATGVSDAVLMTSRDGIHWDRSVKDAWLKGGLYNHEWTERCFITARGIIRRGDYFYIYTEQNYRWDDDGIWAYSIPLYRFMSLYADGDGGSFTTKPLHFVSDDIFLNYDTSAYGYVKVTVLDEEGTELFRSEEIYGNEISHRLHAENLSGKTGTMRIELKEANLYALGSNMK